MEGETATRFVEPTYRLKPHDEKRFVPSAVQAACEEVVRSKLDGKKWSGGLEAMWAKQISEEIKSRVHAMGFDRYKFVVQIVLGEQKSQGARVASRCLWDTETDNFATYSYKNEEMWCVAMVFGCYTE